MHGILGQRHAQGISNAVQKECPNAHGTFDHSLLAAAGLRYAQVNGIGAGLRQKAIGRNHGLHIRGFDGNDNIFKEYDIKNYNLNYINGIVELTLTDNSNVQTHMKNVIMVGENTTNNCFKCYEP
jgi:hypothetical protein